MSKENPCKTFRKPRRTIDEDHFKKWQESGFLEAKYKEMVQDFCTWLHNVAWFYYNLWDKGERYRLINTEKPRQVKKYKKDLCSIFMARACL